MKELRAKFGSSELDQLLADSQAHVTNIQADQISSIGLLDQVRPAAAKF